MTTKEATSQRQFETTLSQLARCYGIESQYKDGNGLQRSVPSTTLQSILSCMGVGVSSLIEARQSLAEVQSLPWRKFIDEVVVVYPSQKDQSFCITLPLGTHSMNEVRIEWTLKSEHSKLKKYRCHGNVCRVVGRKRIKGIGHTRLALSFPEKLPLGYYWLTVTARSGAWTSNGKAFVIAAPTTCYLPVRPRRAWGIALQLYGLRSQRNWGIGDFRDLRRIIKWAGTTLHASTVGVNPLHAPTAGVISPYSPSSRLFFNPLYLDIESIDEFRTTPSLQEWVQGKSFQDELEQVRKENLIQYEKVLALKSKMFEELFQVFYRRHVQPLTVRGRKFERFRKKSGRALERFALFQVLSEQFRTTAWREWPKEFHDPESAAVEQSKKDCEGRIRFYQYLQWQCEDQLRAVDRTANQVQMAYALYLDLPVSVHPDGADAWMFQEHFLDGPTVGAPPDSFNLQGQNWGLMAFHPLQMRAKGYQFFIETIQHNMRYGGVLRIDHALGLFRLFLIPSRLSGTEGAYVQLPVDELLAIVALESVKNRVLVIGEDLGTVTPAVKRRLAKAGLLSYRLLFFEKQPNGAFRSPKQFPEQAAVAVTTHDLPTLRGYWTGRDIELKQEMGLYPTINHADQDWENRAKDRLALLKALQKEHILPLSAMKEIPIHVSQELWQAIHQFLSRTPSRMLVIPWEDLVGELETPNFPGAPSHAYPSWCLKGSRPIESVMTDKTLQRVAKIVKRPRQVYV